MPVTFVCDRCRRAVKVSGSAPDRCPLCEAEVPDALRAATAAALASEPPPKPTLIKVLSFGLAFWAAVGLFVFGVNALSSGGSYTINGEAVTREDFMRRVGAVMLVMPALMAFAGVTAWGLYRDRLWARPAVLGLFAAAFIGPAVAVASEPGFRESLLTGALSGALVVGAPGWYFYGKANVVAYYRAASAGPSPVASAGAPAA
jgi:hypothetical protein